MAKSKLVQVNKKIADAVVVGYKKIEDGVVGAYKKVEDGFVDQFLTHEGETVEGAKKRLAEAQAQREAPAEQAGAHPGSGVGKASLERSLETVRARAELSRNVETH